MTRNRNCKDKIRRSRQLTGVRNAAAARQEAEREQRNRQIHDLLTEATKAIGNTDPGDVPSLPSGNRRQIAQKCSTLTANDG